MEEGVLGYLAQFDSFHASVVCNSCCFVFGPKAQKKVKSIYSENL